MSTTIEGGVAHRPGPRDRPLDPTGVGSEAPDAEHREPVAPLGRRGLAPLRTAPRPASDRRRQLVALAWVGGLVVLALALWLVMLVGAAGDGASRATSQLRPDLPSAGSTAGTRATPQHPTGPADGSSDGRADAADTETPEVDEAREVDPDADPGDDPEELTSVTFDGRCTVTLPVAEVDARTPRPWEHEACAYAPVEVPPGAQRWIVVRASLASADFDAGDAQRRAEELGVDGGVLWSSHYPSLNPDLWVVFEGPFAGPDDAREAAEAADGDAYPRALTVDEDDRFCIAADGCAGERSD